MSIENKIVSGRFHELFRIGDAAAAKAVLAPDFVWHTPAFPETTGSGNEGIARFATLLREAFPDLHFEVTATIAESDRVVAAWSMRGTHTGELMGAPPTGKTVQVSGVNILHIREGQVCELWHNWNEASLWQQLELMPLLV